MNKRTKQGFGAVADAWKGIGITYLGGGGNTANIAIDLIHKKESFYVIKIVIIT